MLSNVNVMVWQQTEHAAVAAAADEEDREGDEGCILVEMYDAIPILHHWHW